MTNMTYQSIYPGAEIDARLTAVATMQAAMRNLEAAVAAKYSKPSSGIPETDMDAGVQSALALARTAIQSLSDYYTKAQVDNIAAAISAAVDSNAGVVVATLPTAAAGTVGKIYYVGPDANGYYDRYVTSYDGSTYAWLSLGSTEVDMEQYVTHDEINKITQIDIVSLDASLYTISSSNKWSKATGASKLRGALIPIAPGKTYRLIATRGATIYAVLHSANTSESTPDWAAGYSGRQSISADESVEFIAPSDGFVLYVYRTNASDAPVYPDVYEITTFEAQMAQVEKNRDDIAIIPEILADLTDLAPTISYTAGGYMTPTGSIAANESYNYSNPIQMKRGDVLTLHFAYAISSDRANVIRCDENGNGLFCAAQYGGLMQGNITDGKFVCQEDGYYRFNIRPSANNVIHWWRKTVVDDNLFEQQEVQPLYPSVNHVPEILNAKMNSGSMASKQRRFSLLHFSDIHGHTDNLYRIRAFAAKMNSRAATSLNDVIVTGDMCGAKFPNYDPALWAQDGIKTMLQVIGNHDVYDAHNDAPGAYDAEAYWATAAEKYAQYIAPNVEYWNVTQPENAEVNGLCYYYKDYDLTNGGASGGVRLICLDAMAFDAAQLAWLVATLESARTAGLDVMIADHFVPITGLPDVQGFETPFHSLLTGMEQNYSVGRLPGAAAAVDDFIDAGGVFICWIAGHMHYDMVGTPVSHPQQTFIAIGTCGPKDNFNDQFRRHDMDLDCFNVYSVDVEKKILSVIRVGGEWDKWMRHRETMTIQYGGVPHLLATF